MISLLTMNIGYVEYQQLTGEAQLVFILSARLLLDLLPGGSSRKFQIIYEASWWSHILLIFFFANMLPYSKHFHVFMSVPNVFLSRLDPLGKLPNMDSITREVKLMLDPETAFAAAPSDAPPEGLE